MRACVAATNRHLKDEVAAGRFRQDLFYRLSVFPIENPPLRERSEDLPALVDHFIKAAAKRLKVRPPKIPVGALRQLAAHAWPGNVRELQNAMERAVILSQGGPAVQASKLSRPGSFTPSATDDPALRSHRAFELPPFAFPSRPAPS